VIVDLPDNEAAAAGAMTVNAAGGATAKTTVLLTPEQVDDAAKRSVVAPVNAGRTPPFLEKGGDCTSQRSPILRRAGRALARPTGGGPGTPGRALSARWWTGAWHLEGGHLQ